MTGCPSPRGLAVHGAAPPDDGTRSDPIPAGAGTVAGSAPDSGAGTGSDPLAGEQAAGAAPAMLVVTLWGTTEAPGDVGCPDQPTAND